MTQRARSHTTAPRERCASCQRPVDDLPTVETGTVESGSRIVCLRCFNEAMATAHGLAFEHVDFPPLDLTDAAGTVRRFEFALRLLGDRLALEAQELLDGERTGRLSQALGAPTDDPFDLQARLVARLRRQLTQRHLEVGVDGRLGIKDFTARGQITWDEEQDGAVPLLIIDGHEVTWDEFGRMPMTFEGWQFRLEIVDKSQEA